MTGFVEQLPESGMCSALCSRRSVSTSRLKSRPNCVGAAWPQRASFVIGIIKIWFWLEMHSNRALRDVKRVELLLITHSQG